MTVSSEILAEIEAQTGVFKPIPMMWPHLSSASKLLRRGNLSVIGGAPGSGKSFMALALGLCCDSIGADWSYIPLESSRKFHLQRLAAILDKSWDAMADLDRDDNAKQKATDAIRRVQGKLDILEKHIIENPNFTGYATPDNILKIIDDYAVARKRVVIIDPLAAVEFNQRNRYEEESRFIRNMVNLCESTGIIIVLVCHTQKKIEGRVIELGDLQGGADLGRLSSACIIVQSHEPKTSAIYRAGGYTIDEEYNRTVYVAKSRNGAGSAPIAFDFGHKAPRFEEIGVISKNKKPKLCDE